MKLSKRGNIIIQSPISGTTINSGRRIVHDITRDEWGNETGTATLNKIKYEVTRAYGKTTWFGLA